MIALAVLGLLWHAVAIYAMILMAPYDKKWEGFYITLLLGPIGFYIVLIMHSNLKEQGTLT
ncbi:MAG TPA: hypothetical protein DCQ83_04875 [Fibrobacteres bacterium]|jgi:hypothetical protein|nr:hypothetical protein [Fibrobacterota bacterium]